MTTAIGVLCGLLLAALAGFAAAAASSRALARRLEAKTRQIEAELVRREQAEKVLRQRETHLRNVLLNADAVVFQLSPDGCIAHIEGRALARIGLAPEIAAGRPVADFFGDNPDVMGSLQRVLGGESVRYATTIRGRHAAIMASPSFDDAGRVAAVWGVATDVTDRTDTERRFRVLFDSARDSILLMRNGLIVECNPWTQTLSGYCREEILGKSPADFSPAEQPSGETSARVLERAIHAPQTFEWVLRHKNGTLVPLEVSLTPMPSAGGNLLLAISRDVTERKNLQEAMLRTEKMATLGSLAAGMAHEINNPLNIILQAAQMTIGAWTRTLRKTPRPPRDSAWISARSRPTWRTATSCATSRASVRPGRGLRPSCTACSGSAAKTARTRKWPTWPPWSQTAWPWPHRKTPSTAATNSRASPS